MQSQLFFFFFFLFITVHYAQSTDYLAQCAACICEAATGCDTDLQSCEYYGGEDNEACGPMAITKPYWIGAGALSYDESLKPLSTEAFIKCATDTKCALEVVANAIKKTKTDCDHDGQIDCDDYALLHLYGETECVNFTNQQSFFGQRYSKCKWLVNGLDGNGTIPLKFD